MFNSVVNFNGLPADLIDQTIALQKSQGLVKVIENSSVLITSDQQANNFFYDDEQSSLFISGTFSIKNLLGFTELDKNKLVYLLNDLYRRYDAEFVKYLQGFFVAIFVDKKHAKVVIASDRFATQSLYYSYLPAKKTLIFSSSLKFVTALSPQLNLENQAIFNYLYFHMIPSPGTIYKNISKLGPAEVIEFSDDKLQRHYYWQPQFNEQHNVTKHDYAKQLIKVLDESVTTARGTDDVGAFLSGGLDSSSVSGLLSHQQKLTPTFSIGFPVSEYNEIEYARIATQYFNTERHEYFIQPSDVADALPTIMSYMDEPFGNSSVLPVYFCAKMAKKQGVNILLAGDGGDEIFAGNKRYLTQQVFEYYDHVPVWLRHNFLAPLAYQFSQIPVLAKAHRYIEQANIPLPDRLETYNFLHRHQAATIFTENFLKSVDVNYPIHLIREVYQRPKEASSLNRMLYLDWKHTLADNDLRKVSSMCRLNGVDVRYPMLHDAVVDLSCAIPSSLKLARGKLRYFYKYAMRDFLPKEIIHKRKHGFGLPFGVWLATDKQLQNMAAQAIENQQLCAYFRPEFLHELIHLHANTHQSYYGEMLWIVMILSQWLQKR